MTLKSRTALFVFCLVSAQNELFCSFLIFPLKNSLIRKTASTKYVKDFYILLHKRTGHGIGGYLPIAKYAIATIFFCIWVSTIILASTLM